MPLTHTGVKNAKVGRHSDGGGLYLLVKPQLVSEGEDKGKPKLGPDGKALVASKSWVLRVQHNGMRRDFGLGAFIEKTVGGNLAIERRKLLTLIEAREKANKGRLLAKAGINPSAAWRELEAAETPPVTFEQAAREYHKQVSRSWRNSKHGDQWINTLETYAFPHLGKMSVADIDASAIQKVLLPIWLSKGETARRVRQRIGAVLDYAQGKGWREAEAPMRSLNQLMGGIKQPKGGNFAAMPYADVPAFMAKLAEADASVGRLALQFLILTAARSGEVRGATWGEFDLDAAEWRIPPERMKADKLHIVPLVPAAVAILKQMRGLFPSNASDIVFPGLKGKLMSDATMAKAMRVAGGGNYTVHGFRSSFRDWAAETGLNNDWAEAVLAHSVAGQEGKTVASYKRTTFFDQRRDKLMPAWASFILADSSNVVRLAATA